MKYRKFYRKTSLKQKGIGEIFLDEIQSANPKSFFEIGIFHGVTARNICDLMYKNHKYDFKYTGIDLFDQNVRDNEIAPNFKFNNPLKTFYFKYIKRQNPYSALAVNDLLKKYKKNVEIITGNTNETLKNLNLQNIEYIFIDGGHDFETVKNDLFFSSKFLKAGGTILCDDYDLTQAPGVKKAIDEFVINNKCKFSIIASRFAKIEF
ncbi:MAG: class I SAM-dependent methyltransferase [Candidatus Pelagibacter sp.]